MEPLDISKLKYVLFDWDNTLAESRPALVAAVNKVLAAYNLPDWEISKEKRDCNLSFKDNFANVFGKQNAKAAYEQYREIYKELVPTRIASFPYAQKVLDFFAVHNVRMMIVTNKERCLIEYELPLLYDKNLFCNIVCGHEAKADKPHKEHALYALKNYISEKEISPQNVWVIGDSPQDSLMAERINALPIRVNQSIWGDESENSNKMIHFSGFQKLYETLISGKE